MSDAPLTAADFARLLEIQELDTKIDQLRYRRAHLPAITVVEGITAEAISLRSRMEALQLAQDTLAGRQAALAGEIATISARITQLDQRLYGPNAVTNPRDAHAMAEEAKHLRERRNALEDDEFAIMEELEPAQDAVHTAEADAGRIGSLLRDAQGERGTEEAAIDEELAGLTGPRDTAMATLPGVLRNDYERLRKSTGTIAAAPLIGTACGGCHLTLAGAELEAVRKAPESEIVHCDECGRILVRQ